MIISRNSVLSVGKTGSNDPGLKEHARGSRRFCSRIKFDHHQLPVGRHIKQASPVVCPVGLRTATSGNAEMPAGSAKWRNEDGVGTGRTQWPDIGDPFAVG